MITSVKGVALRFFWRNKTISALSILSVCLSVFLIITMFLFVYNTKADLMLEQTKSEISIQLRYIAILSVLLLAITVLIIQSNFQIFVYKYKKQLALMRSIGAKQSDLFKILFIQITTINGTGSLAGYLLSVLGNKIWFPIVIKVLDAPTNVSSFNHLVALSVMVSSFVIIQVLILIPLRKASRILPLKLMQNNELNTFRNPKNKERMGRIFLAGAIFFLLFGLIMAADEDTRALLIMLFVLFLFIGALLLLPVYIIKVLNRLLPFVHTIAGKLSYVAVKNMIPRIRDNTFTILSVSAMMIVSIFGSSILTTIQTNEEHYIKQSYPTEIVISNPMENQPYTTNFQEVKKAILLHEGVKEAGFVSRIGGILSIIGNKEYHRISHALADFDGLRNLGLLPLAAPLYNSGKEESNVVINQKAAAKYNLAVGDIINLSIFSESKQKELPAGQARIVDIQPSFSFTPAEMLVDWTEQRFSNAYMESSYKYFIDTDDPAPLMKGMPSLKQLYPGLEMNTLHNSLEQNKRTFNQNWALFIAVLTAVLIGLTGGVFTTLINNIYSRRKEYAVLRTLSVRPSGIIKVILTQTSTFILVGQIIGVVMGLCLTYAFLFLDSSKIYINYTFNLLIALMVACVSVAVFTVYGTVLSKQSITKELGEE